MPYVALPPASLKGGRALTVALWHPLGAAGSPEAMAAALPLRGVPAWRVYFGLPGTGSRALDLAADSDLVLDIDTPMVEQAAAEFVMVAAGPNVRAPVLLVVGEHEYPEFRPDQDALLRAWRPGQAGHRPRHGPRAGRRRGSGR